jgi:hypothetical protein
MYGFSSELDFIPSYIYINKYLQKSCTFYNLQVQKKKEMNSSLPFVPGPLPYVGLPVMVREKLYWQTTGDHGDDIEAAELSSSENPGLKAWILGNSCGIIGLTGTGKWRTEVAMVRSLILPTSLQTWSRTDRKSLTTMKILKG